MRPVLSTAVVALTVAAVTLLSGQTAGAQPSDGSSRVRDLVYRSASLDNSERVAQSGQERTVSLSADVLFEFDSDALVPGAAARLDELAGELKGLGPRTVTVAGHTDSRGEPDYNQALSKRRAASARDALADRLGRQFQFEVSGYGEDEPVAPNEKEDGSDNPEGRALNRRVEIQYPTG